jgi:hypothetical protein
MRAELQRPDAGGLAEDQAALQGLEVHGWILALDP